MVKLRTNHGYSRGGATLVRLIIIAGCLIALIFFVLKKSTDGILSADLTSTPGETRYYLPSGGYGQVVHYPKFSYSFKIKDGHPEWVAYKLTSASIDSLRSTIAPEFIPDPELKDFWLEVDHLTKSGYIAETYLPPHFFHPSNGSAANKSFITMMCPVHSEIHKGIWKELQYIISQNVEKKGDLIVVTGPIFDEKKSYIPGSDYLIPCQYFFAFLYPEPGMERAIGFIVPNRQNDITLPDRAVSIDSLEVLTGLDFFNQFLEVEQEKLIEADYNLSVWYDDSN